MSCIFLQNSNKQGIGLPQYTLYLKNNVNLIDRTSKNIFRKKVNHVALAQNIDVSKNIDINLSFKGALNKKGTASFAGINVKSNNDYPLEINIKLKHPVRGFSDHRTEEQAPLIALHDYSNNEAFRRGRTKDTIEFDLPLDSNVIGFLKDNRIYLPLEEDDTTFFSLKFGQISLRRSLSHDRAFLNKHRFIIEEILYIAFLFHDNEYSLDELFTRNSNNPILNKIFQIDNLLLEQFLNFREQLPKDISSLSLKNFDEFYNLTRRNHPPLLLSKDGKENNKTIPNSHHLLKNQTNKNINNKEVTTTNNVADYFDDALNIIHSFREYQQDIVKMMEMPVLANLQNTKVKTFSFICEDIMLSRKEKEIINRTTYLHLRNEYDALISYAQTVQISTFEHREQRSINDARVMLNKMLDDATTKNERNLSGKGLIKKLHGVFPLSAEVIDKFKIDYNLQSIEK